MSDNIPPFEIQAEILKRVSDVKSLLQFRSVSKSWKSVIDNPRFIAGYHRNQPPRHHIFLWYHVQILDTFVSMIDNDDDNSHSFAQHKVPLPIPSSFQSHGVDSFIVIGSSSKGLICFYEHIYRDRVVLWNPTIRKSVTIDVPKASYEYTMGFGVSPESDDPKLVKIQRFGNALDDLKPRQAELYSLSTGEWRTLSEDLPRSSVAFYNHDGHAAIGNFICWLAHEKAMKREMIISFDMTSEKFMEIYIPDSVTKDAYNELCLFKIQESLAVAVIQNDRVVYQVWMMEGTMDIL
uniref:putative F-box protein At1g32420 n=1 Tax=Erigeron canadensis TaxID=72917 RepID=UPI001CB99C9F|nr:putative F-box protein At1g32420 [Erigeron canadensis]